MTAKTMAEVLAEHSNLEWSFEYGGFICSKCGWQETYALPYQRDAEGGARTAHQSASLSAAGFGLVADAKAEALEEAAAVMDKSAEVLLMMWGDKQMTEAATATLSATRHEARRVRARAAALRGES